jgi:REP element-mobilizing transposase RayT
VLKVPRPLRVQTPGVYHLTAQGVRHSALFRAGRDRSDWVDLLPELCGRYRWTCLSYCVMTTHFHLLVRTHAATLAAGMQWLNGRWGEAFNRRHREVGHVFRCRYRSELISREEHLLEVSRYIPLNPVRAGLCLDPLDWPWSSVRVLLGIEAEQRWLNGSELLELFGSGRERYRRFRTFLADGTARAA